MSRDARDIDDASLAARRHRRAELLAGYQRAADQVQVEVRPPVVAFNRFERPLSRDCRARVVAAGRVNENARRAESRRNRLMSTAQARPLERIGKEELRGAANRSNPPHASVAALAIAADNRDSCAGAGQAFRHHSAQHSGPADHHGNLSRQVE